MPSAHPNDPRLDQARELIRERGLSRQELRDLETAMRLLGVDQFPLLAVEPGQPSAEPVQLARLHASFGLFLVFLNQIQGQPPQNLEETRATLGLVLQHSLATLEETTAAAHQEMLAQHQEPDWVFRILDLIAALRTMAISLDPQAGEGSRLKDHWSTFLQEEKEPVRRLFATLGRGEQGPALVEQLNQQMKLLNRTLQSGTGNPLAALRKLEMLLAAALPEDTRLRAEPLLLVQHVISSLRISLFRPLDRGFHWPAVEQIKGSLQWLWDHLGWTMPRADEHLLEHNLPLDVRNLLKLLRESHPPAFRIVARALASHLNLLRLVEGMEPAVSSSIPRRYAMIPSFWVIEAELGRLAERVFHPRCAELLPRASEEALLLGAFLRQAVLALLQDQATIRSFLQQTLANDDVDQLAVTLDNLRALLLSHQRQLMGDLVGLFSPELRQKLFPDSPSLAEEGDRLRQRLYRLWLYLDPVLAKVQVNLELQDWPRLALALAQAHSRVVAFRRSPEFLLIRNLDRQEFERLTQQFTQALEDPAEIEPALREGADLVGELLRFLDLFLLRINARVPLIRLDLNTAREAHGLAADLVRERAEAPDRVRLAHKLIQATKTLAVRDPQSRNLLKRWVRAERGGRDFRGPLEALLSHLEHLASRLDAALN
jgi:hypothetical protein